jgi:hypothetical protein
MSNSEVSYELHNWIAEAGEDERRVLLFICRRFIGLGQRCIGRLNLAAEKRDGLQETAEEAADGLFYMSLRFLLAQISRPSIPDDRDTEPGSVKLVGSGDDIHFDFNKRGIVPKSPLKKPCEVCGGPGPVLYNEVSGSNPKNIYRYCCQKCHGNPDDPFFTRRHSTAIGPARYRNEAGQLVEDDDVPEEDWP